MPVGRVFNAAENQVLISPVSSHYRGKAIRQGLARGELENQLLEEEVQNAPSKREAARQAALLKAENIQSQIDKRIRDGEIEELELSAKALTPLLTDYSNEKNQKKAMDDFNANIGTAIQSLSTPEQERIAKAMGPDKKFDHEEIHRIGLGVRMFADQKDSGRTAQKFIDANGKPVQGSMDKQGNYFDSSGEQRTDITPIAPQAGQDDISSLAGGAAEDKTAARQIREVMGASDNLIMSMDRISTIVKDAPQSSLGLPGGVSSLVDQAINAATGFSEIAGGWAEVNGQKVDEKSLLDTRLYRDVFEGASATNAALQANAIGVSYALARAANPDGRISDADVRHQLKRLQLEQSSKARIFAAMEEVKRETLGSAMNWLRTSGATETEDGREAYSKYADMFEKMDVLDEDDIYTRARAAIAAGADAEAVKKRLAESGVDPSKL